MLETMEVLREISASVVMRQAEAGARQLVNALERVNSSFNAAQLPAPRVEPSASQQAFAMLYAEFVGRWFVIRP